MMSRPKAEKSLPSIQAAEALTNSSLPTLPRWELCSKHIDGLCRDGERCTFTHAICQVESESEEPERPIIDTTRNVLAFAARRPRYDKSKLEIDGPGELTSSPRHDNDFTDISHVKVLPTGDEILSQRRPYMPVKDYASHAIPGVKRLTDLHFRHLRYDSTEPIIDICYHAIQSMVSLGTELNLASYDDRMQTPRGIQYSMFRNVEFVETQFNDQHSLSFRISFACPEALRGKSIYKSSCLQEGMMAVLVGFDAIKGRVSVTFLEVVRRESTMAMKYKTNNDLRASCVVGLADPSDLSASRRLLYNKHGLLSEQFVLVDLPTTLYPGFSWCLERLKMISRSNDHMAFSSLIAPDPLSTSENFNKPPLYCAMKDLTYDLSVLRKRDIVGGAEPLTLRPHIHLQDPQARQSLLDTLRRETTLDEGQTLALCENLCRGLAFTQGPPGTGKTYLLRSVPAGYVLTSLRFLGVSLTKTLLASRRPDRTKPILVVCTTNHALDSFLHDLRKDGITKLVRLGAGSQEEWIEPFRPRAILRRVKGPPGDAKNYALARVRCDGLSFQTTSFSSDLLTLPGLGLEGTGMCTSLNQGLMNWPAVSGHLERNYNSVYRSLADVEHVDVDQKPSEIRISRQAGGFAFEFWCSGGDLNDIESLLETFHTMLGRNVIPGTCFDSDYDPQAMSKVVSQVSQNAVQLSGISGGDIWAMPLKVRLQSVKKWQEEIGPAIIADQAIELHRRHQTALQRLNKVRVDGGVYRYGSQDVIGLTTTACAKNWPLLSKLELETVICEEAGEVIEAHSLCTLFPSIKHAIFIGDPLQLRAQVNETEMGVEKSKSYRLDQSLFERMMFPSLREIEPFPTSQLNIQRRAHPDVANIMRATLYPKLKDAKSTRQHPKVAGMAERLFWLDHRHREERPHPRSGNPKSYLNTYEVDMIFALVHYLVHTNEYNFGDIAVLTPYNGQLEALNQRLRGTCSIWLIDKDKEKLRDLQTPDGYELDERLNEDTEGKITFDMSNMLRLATIDNFQGEEAKIVILSTVRSNTDRRVGFLKTLNRINVACSRARHGFYIIGNASLMQTADMWHSIIELLTQKRKIGTNLEACCSRHPFSKYKISRPDDFAAVPACAVACDAILPCGHLCKDTCHPHALHARKICTYPCAKRLDSCGHPCPKLCGEPCGDCTQDARSVLLTCGHMYTSTCQQEQDGSNPICESELDPIQLACGHNLTRRCGSENEPLVCQETCSTILACGHECSERCVKCHDRGVHSKCSGQCGRTGDCGHTCQYPCHQGTCPPCEVICENPCEHGKFKHRCSTISDPCTRPCARVVGCQAICSLPCTRTASNNPCPRMLKCGHSCPTLEDERCPDICLQCTTGKLPQYIQVCLPCTHTIDVKTLDRHCGIVDLFEIDDLGMMGKPKSTAMDELSGCPKCGEAVEEIRRYSCIKRLRNLSTALDELYVMLGQKMRGFMSSINYARLELKDDRKSFVQRLKSGPLGGRTNATLVTLRGRKTVEIESSIRTFKDNVATPFEKSISSLEDLIGQKPLAVFLPRAGSEDESLMQFSPVDLESSTMQDLALDNRQHQEDTLSDQDPVENGNFPDTAITREIMKQAREREKAQSSWTVRRRPRPFIATKSRPPMTGTEGDFNVANSPFILRFESLYHRCRLQILEDAIFAIDEVKKLDQSTHTSILLQGLHTLIITEAQELITRLDTVITASAFKALKRLEVEFRLIQLHFHIILTKLGISSHVNVQTSVGIALDLCYEYPDTAGIFLPSCNALKRGLEKGTRDWNIDLYSKNASMLWKKWGAHEVGCLRHCVNGHPYSGYTFAECPECGRRVEPKTKIEDTTDYASFLKEDEFVAKMKAMKPKPKQTKSFVKEVVADDES